jgi:NitT/TauT family transport system permease protein
MSAPSSTETLTPLLPPVAPDVRLRRILYRCEFVPALAALVAFWQFASLAAGNPTILPTPLAVLRAWVELLRGDLIGDALASLAHLGIGYALGVTTGLVLAALAAYSETVEAIVDPLIEVLRPIGAIAWIPLAILMFGVGGGVPIFLIFHAALSPVFVNAFAGIKETDQRLVRAAESLGASRRMIVARVILPAALPLILAGARLSLGVSWMALIAAELTGSDAGLGWRIFWYQEFFATDKVMAVILTIGLLGYVLDTAMRRLQRRLTRFNPAADGGR